MDLTFKEINPIYHEDYGNKESGSGVVPYLPLPELKKGSNN